MQLHPHLATTLVSEHQRDLRRGAERRRTRRASPRLQEEPLTVMSPIVEN